MYVLYMHIRTYDHTYTHILGGVWCVGDLGLVLMRVVLICEKEFLLQGKVKNLPKNERIPLKKSGKSCLICEKEFFLQGKVKKFPPQTIFFYFTAR